MFGTLNPISIEERTHIVFWTLSDKDRFRNRAWNWLRNLTPSSKQKKLLTPRGNIDTESWWRKSHYMDE
jgi:hypothetical protein